MNISSWFTAKRREAIYVAVAALVPALVMFGIIADDQVEDVLTIVAIVLQVVAAVLALFHMSPVAAGEWFVTAGRAAIYAAAAIAAPAAVGLGWITEAQSVTWLGILSVVLTVVAAVIGVVNLKDDAPEEPEYIEVF